MSAVSWRKAYVWSSTSESADLVMRARVVVFRRRWLLLLRCRLVLSV